jgi:hypothetical protein
MGRRVALVLGVVLAAAIAWPQAASAAAGDRAIAKRVLSRVADFPAGWTADATSKPSDSGCFSTPAKAQGPTARAQASPDFINQASQERAGANVWIFPSPRKARAALTAMTAAPPLACYRTTIRDVLTSSGITVTSFVKTPISLEKLGDSATAMRLTVAVRKGSQRAQLIIDLFYVQRRRALVAVGFNAQSSTPLVADERATVARSVARVPA